MSDRDGYLEQIARRFEREGFAVSRAVEFDGYQLDVLAVKTSFELFKFGNFASFVGGAWMEAADTKAIREFSSSFTQYALEKGPPFRGLGAGLVSFPVIVSQDFDDDVKEWVRSTPAPKHWGAGEFPVLVSLKERRIFVLEKSPLWGRVYWGGLRKFARKQLAF